MEAQWSISFHFKDACIIAFKRACNHEIHTHKGRSNKWQPWEEKNTNKLITNLTQCGLPLQALLNVGRHLSLIFDKIKLHACTKDTAYLHFWGWPENSHIYWRNGLHCRIVGEKQWKMTVNSTTLCFGQNLVLLESQRFPQDSFRDMGEKFDTQIKNVNSRLCSLQKTK